MLDVHAMIIDPQNGFMGDDNGNPYSFSLGNNQTFEATLPVKGSMSDMQRNATMLARIGNKLNDIHVTMDSHQPMDVAHQAFWRDTSGNSPNCRTSITASDIQKGIWLPRVSQLRDRMLKYVEELERKGNYPLIIWPDHCGIGTPSHNIYPPLMAELNKWCVKNRASIDFVTKGSNPFTEHYGALEAEVPDPNDPSTQLNSTLIEVLRNADMVCISGEASSHCVKATIQQLVDNIGDSHLNKIHLLVDCMSPVAQPPGGLDFPAIASQFLQDMKNRGLHLTKSTEFLA